MQLGFHHGLLGGILAALTALAAAAPAGAQAPTTAPEIYAQWCARCHGADGSGKVAVPTIKTEPLDFTDCKIATAEPAIDWELVIARGGPVAGLSPEMPAFGAALSHEKIAELVAYLRRFCGEPGWPSGDLNFPRPILTEKAFPENEVVILPFVSHAKDGADTGFRLRAVYERRFGRRAHGEIGVPFESVGASGMRESGFGDVSIAGKYVLHDDADRVRILTAGLELVFPTGSERRGLGSGTVVVEPYLAAGTVWRGNYVQAQLKLELPERSFWNDRELVYNTYFGRDTADTPDTWTLGVELNGVNRAVAITPQIRKGLTRTGALGAAFGVQLPLVQRDEQRVRWVSYLLWDYLEPVLPRR
jgi:mono/diheme cytochrome c family protein